MRLVLRLLGFAIGILIGWQTGSLLALASEPTDETGSVLFLVALAIGGIGYVLGPHVSWAVVRNVRQVARAAAPIDLVAVALGFAFGGLVAALLAVPLSALPDPFGAFLPLVVSVVACALAVMVALLRKRDLIEPRLPRRRVAEAEAAIAQAVPPPILLDTSVVIDGRIAAVARSGFLDARLAIPRFVLEELQRVADAADPQRRARGRRGLDTLDRLREQQPGGIEIVEADVPEAREVDAKLVRLARARGARILTNDHNLGRVADLQGVRVLNLNELAGALRPAVLPGEEIRLRLVQEGREAGQGVGFLDDGTMVVVDGGRPLVGQLASVTVTRLLPTGAGRLVFAVPKPAPATAPS